MKLFQSVVQNGTPAISVKKRRTAMAVNRKSTQNGNLTTNGTTALSSDVNKNDDVITTTTNKTCQLGCGAELRALRRQFDEYRRQTSLEIAELRAELAEAYEMCSGDAVMPTDDL